MKTILISKLIYRLILWSVVIYFFTTTAGQFFRLILCRIPVLLRGTVHSRPCLAVVCGYRFLIGNHPFNILNYGRKDF